MQVVPCEEPSRNHLPWSLSRSHRRESGIPMRIPSSDGMSLSYLIRCDLGAKEETRSHHDMAFFRSLLKELFSTSGSRRLQVKYAIERQGVAENLQLACIISTIGGCQLQVKYAIGRTPAIGMQNYGNLATTPATFFASRLIFSANGICNSWYFKKPLHQKYNLRKWRTLFKFGSKVFTLLHKLLSNLAAWGQLVNQARGEREEIRSLKSAAARDCFFLFLFLLSGISQLFNPSRKKINFTAGKIIISGSKQDPKSICFVALEKQPRLLRIEAALHYRLSRRSLQFLKKNENWLLLYFYSSTFHDICSSQKRHVSFGFRKMGCSIKCLIFKA